MFDFSKDNIVDLRSDTVTEMSPEMRMAMAYALTGDMLYNEDKNVIELENIVRELFTTGDCLWTPSCTMANLIGILLARRSLGCELILGKNSHINTLERKNATFIGGLSYKPVNDIGGYIRIRDIKNAIVQESEFFPEQVAIALENTHNLAGGTVFTPSYLNEVCDIAFNNKLRVHLDGARIFNASVALNIFLSEWILNKNGPDTISISLSKCLGTPAGGALLVKNQKEKEKAKYIRKSIGGTMHTGAGYLAAAAVKQLEKGYEAGIASQLIKDHKLASYFAKGISLIPEHYKLLHEVKTNIIYVSCKTRNSSDIKVKLQENNIYCSCLPSTDLENNSNELPLRFVTHRGILKKDIDHVLSILNKIAK